MEVLTDDDREKIRQSIAKERVHRMFSFIAGVIGTLGITISGWSYALNSECTERQERLNVILAAAGLRAEKEPEVIAEPTERAKRSSSIYCSV